MWKDGSTPPPTNQTYPKILAFFQEVHSELRETEVYVNRLGFQSVNAIFNQIFDEIRYEMGPNNLRIEELEQPTKIILPAKQDMNIVIAT